MRNMKKPLSFILCIVLVLSLCALPAAGEETAPEGEPAAAEETVSAGAEAPGDGAVPAEPEFVQVPVSGVKATGYITGRNVPDTYAPGKMIDGDDGTTWQFSVKECKLGEAYAEFDFDAPAELDALWIKNGFWKINRNGRDQYTRNSRVKTMTVLVRYDGAPVYEELMTVTLKDDRSRTGWQTVDMPGLTDVTGVRLRIDDIYRGSAYRDDVGITEVMFVRTTR